MPVIKSGNASMSGRSVMSSYHGSPFSPPTPILGPSAAVPGTSIRCFAFQLPAASILRQPNRPDRRLIPQTRWPNVKRGRLRRNLNRISPNIEAKLLHGAGEPAPMDRSHSGRPASMKMSRSFDDRKMTWCSPITLIAEALLQSGWTWI